jgi:predicted metallo-beta-lactamase superfamily hydrolase
VLPGHTAGTPRSHRPGRCIGVIPVPPASPPCADSRGRRLRQRILQLLVNATDVVFSPFHGDHVTLVRANPYQLSLQQLPSCFPGLRCWSKSDEGWSPDMSKRFQDLAELMGANLQVAEGRSEGPLSFSRAAPHGAPNSNMGTLMMTRIEMDNRVFVHASDIQLLDDATVDRIIDWRPDIVLAAGPPLYLDRLNKVGRERAWDNAVRLAQSIDIVILDHHLMRSEEGEVWLDRLSATVDDKLYCAADYMDRSRRLLEAERARLYEEMPVPRGWHDEYAAGRVDAGEYFDAIADRLA